MRVLVVDGALLSQAREQTGADDDVFVVAPTPDELEHLQHEATDPRVYYLIGDREVLPLPDAFVDDVHGAAADEELRRVRR